MKDKMFFYTECQTIAHTFSYTYESALGAETQHKVLIYQYRTIILQIGIYTLEAISFSL